MTLVQSAIKHGWIHLRNVGQSPVKPVCETTKRQYIRPTFAPRPTIDLKHIARNPGLYEQNCIDRNYADLSGYPNEIARLREQRTQITKSLNVHQRLMKSLQAQLAAHKSASGIENGDLRDHTDLSLSLRQEAREKSGIIAQETREAARLDEQMLTLALALPNLSSVDTPSGSDPILIETRRNGPAQERTLKSHVDIANELDLVDFAPASTTSGWGWYFLKNEAVLLEQALVRYALEVCMERGWTIMSPPSIVYSHIAAGCGFQPRDANGEQQIYQIQMPQSSDKGSSDAYSLSLAGTAEIPLAGYKAGQALQLKELPLKVVASSRCYRAEAGARGVDTKGLYRVHEFTKVEMFAWTLPDDVGDEHENFGSAASGRSYSAEVLNEMVGIQQTILDSLGLDYRLLEMPMHDLGASAARKRDIEAYFPSRKERSNGWGEVTSASICTDYQSRRLGTRYAKPDSSLGWPHTVNGTALAVPRILAALLETHWDETSKTVSIPEVLQPYVGQMSRISRA